VWINFVLKWNRLEWGGDAPGEVVSALGDEVFEDVERVSAELHLALEVARPRLEQQRQVALCKQQSPSSRGLGRGCGGAGGKDHGKDATMAHDTDLNMMSINDKGDDHDVDDLALTTSVRINSCSAGRMQVGMLPELLSQMPYTLSVLRMMSAPGASSGSENEWPMHCMRATHRGTTSTNGLEEPEQRDDWRSRTIPTQEGSTGVRGRMRSPTVE
jgi:hypothetical protein